MTLEGQILLFLYDHSELQRLGIKLHLLLLDPYDSMTGSQEGRHSYYYFDN